MIRKAVDLPMDINCDEDFGIVNVWLMKHC